MFAVPFYRSSVFWSLPPSRTTVHPGAAALLLPGGAAAGRRGVPAGGLRGRRRRRARSHAEGPSGFLQWLPSGQSQSRLRKSFSKVQQVLLYGLLNGTSKFLERFPHCMIETYCIFRWTQLLWKSARFCVIIDAWHNVTVPEF